MYAHISCQFRKDGEILCLPLLRTEVLLARQSADLNLDNNDNYTGIFFLLLHVAFSLDFPFSWSIHAFNCYCSGVVL